MATKKRLLTGLQPSGQLHIGNYFGALKPFIDRHSEFESFLMIADYHAITSLKNSSDLRSASWNVTLDYLAAGLDPKKSVIFKQSEVPQHTELAWIFECLVTMPFLMQAHAFKAHAGRAFIKKHLGNKTFDEYFETLERNNVANKYDDLVERMFSGVNVGLFNYPMLMAADILLYDTDFVPVGKDQAQHIEYAREAGAKFNNAFSNTFKDPKGIFLEDVPTVPGTDGQKMSKSYRNTIPLFASKDEVAKVVMKIITDSGPISTMGGEETLANVDGSGRPKNLYAIHRLLKSEAELAPLYDANKGKYKALKEALIEDLDTYFAPMRERRKEYAEQPDKVRAILAEGGEKARSVAEAKMKAVRKAVGVSD